MSLDDDLDTIETGLMQLHKTSFQHKGWENLIQEAGVNLDRPAAALLKVLLVVDKPCKILDVAQYLGIEAPSVSRKVKELEDAGLLTRKPDEYDGRVSNLSLTAKGREQLTRLQRVRRAHLARTLASWSEDDRHKLAQLFAQLTSDLTQTKK